ncbi:MAG: citramalate synthase [Polyangiales bacterium]
MRHVETYDTTLRDGTQREGISLSCEDKLRIAQRLDSLGIDVIEAGFPGSNPKDAEVFRRARDMSWQHARLAAFGATRRPSTHVEAELRTLVEAKTPVCTIFGKSSTLHVLKVLGTTLDENLRMIEESVAYLRAEGRRVVYDAEHFFDGFRLDPAYALETLRAAERGGADVVVLCDTNGGTLPSSITRAVLAASEAIHARIGIHAHDDIGCAIASTLVAVEAGASHVQGTINGYGERCGNADLVAVIAGIELKLGFSALPPGRLAELSSVSRFVAEIANLTHDPHLPYVGKSAFAHKGGVHVAAVRRAPESYQHVDPAIVGNELRVVVSELAGRATVRSKAEELGIVVAGETDREVATEIKAREAEGSSYEAAEASVALMVRRKQPGYVPPFRVLDWKVIAQGAHAAEATIKIDLGGRAVHTAAEGCGPVAALDAALRKALFPAAEAMRLADYKVRILDGRDGTGAVTRVLVDTTDGVRSWSTVGAAPSILDASIEALADGYEYGLVTLEKSVEKTMEEVA